ncbi:MAG: alpha-2-macroglobulin family protein, partial [Fibrobacteria bacterium]|nr:alpha-2-macroglobulin family protein [Fibrobacteria bacterium]
DLPETPGVTGRRNYHWRDVKYIGKKVLEKAVRVKLQPIPSEHTFSEINSFKIKQQPGTYLYIKLKKGTPFYGGYILSKRYEIVKKVKPYPKQLSIMHDGMILSRSGEQKISVITQGIKGVRFRVGRVRSDQLNHLVTQSNGNLAQFRFTNYQFDEENIVENFYEKISLADQPPDEPNFLSFSPSKYLSQPGTNMNRRGIFFLEVREWDSKYDRVLGTRDKRLILITDLGVLSKDGANGTHELFIQSVSTGRPVSEAKVQVLGKNGIPVITSYSNSRGYVKLAALDDFKNEKEAVAYLITKDGDVSVLPVKAPGRWLDYSRYEVGGEHGHVDPKKINAYLFSDRGIYRPGDTLNVGMILKTSDWKYSLKGTPFEVVLADPRGMEIFKNKFTLSSAGFEEFRYSTESSSPTGTYQVNLYTIKNRKRHRSVGHVTVRVEEFLPDRLTIRSNFSIHKERGWVSPDALTNRVTLKNLFGSPAVGNRITGRLTLSPGQLFFNKYKDYLFSGSQSVGKYYTENLVEKITDKEGKAEFDLALERFTGATYNVTFSANGYEKEGGRFVSAVSRVLVSPLAFLVGTKANGDLKYIQKDSERKLDIIAINPDLKQIETQTVRFELSRITYVSTLTKRNNGTYAYKSIPKSVLFTHFSKSISSSGYVYTIPTAYPGDYELHIKNSSDEVLSHVKFSVVGKGNFTRTLDKTAELKIKLNKGDYKPGEEIELFIQAPYTGAGLVTIERERVYAFKWFTTEDNSFIQKIQIPENMEGNGYINVSFVRAVDSREIYMSPHSYGVAPFSISRERRVNKLHIKGLSRARSGRPYKITYSSDKPGHLVLFAVDEGILQVADYKTPDPLSYFFKKRALEVRTAQILDLILPEYSLLKGMSAPGGGSGFDKIAKNLNPFQRKRHKPVVFWSGIIPTNQKEKNIKFTVPDYFNGTLRVMGVAVSNDAIGTFEEKVIVRNPFVISPNLPMFAAPEDSFVVTATITNMQEGSGKGLPVTLTLSSSKNIKLPSNTMKLMLDENADTTVSLPILAKKDLGSAFIEIKASSKQESASLKSFLSIRPAIPYRTSLQSGVLKQKRAEVTVSRDMYEDYRVLETSVSFLPLGLSRGLKCFLDKFPYGCTEQVLSQAIPYLFLRSGDGFDIKPKEAEAKIEYALKVLSARQNANGQFGIWASNAHSSDFITVYGAHFLTDCKRKGITISSSILNRALQALKNIARANTTSLHQLRIQAYAIYVLTRNQIVTTQYLTKTVNVLKKEHPNWESDIAAGYIAATWFLLKKEVYGLNLIRKVASGDLQYKDKKYVYDTGTDYSQLLYLLALHFPEEMKRSSASAISRIASYLEENCHNTISSAYAVMGLAEYSDAAGTVQSGKVTVSQWFQDNKQEVLLLPDVKFPTTVFSPKAQEIRIASQEKKPLYYQVVQAGYDTELPSERVAKGLELYREFTNQNGKKITEAKLGEELRVNLKFRSVSGKELSDIAIVDLLPAGLEAVPISVRKQKGGSWHPEYVDVREDRLVIFGRVPEKLKTFSYNVRAVNRGRFTVPPLYGESMYDNSVYGESPQGPLVIR